MIDFSREIKFQTARSGGKGGQHVNKVETMVEARWNVGETVFFTPVQQQLILSKLKNHISVDGILIMRSSEARTQLDNKAIVTRKMLTAVHKSLVVRKKRVATKPTKGMIEKRLISKKMQSERKQNRSKNWE